MLTRWLQELRDVLAMSSDDGRRDAMRRWEQRWLVPLQHRQIIPTLESAQASRALLTQAETYVSHALGQHLGELMVQVRHRDAGDPWSGDAPMLEVRGEVLAIRREPQDGD